MSSRIRLTAAFALVLSAASLIAAQRIPAAVTNVRVTKIEPVIWGVTASAVTASQATINWTTDLLSDSLVEYGLTTSYGNTTTRNTTLITTHAMTIAGLVDSRLYHFRVRSRDAGGIEGVSRDYTFTTLAPATILWAADHEEGNMSDWYAGNGGLESNSGNAVSMASTDVAHGGSYSAKATITPPPVAGVRLSRSQPSLIPQSAYFSSWYYFPRNYTVNGFWNIMSFKSRDCNSGCPSATTDPFWDLKVENRANGNMYVYLSWWGDLWTQRGVEGPHQGEFGWFNYQQTLKDLPVGQWVHLEVYLRQSSSFTGQIIVWQDGVEIFNQNNVKTRYPFEGDRWMINNYSDSISPSPATIYFDDAAISTARVWSGTSDTTPPAVSITAPAGGTTVSGSTATIAADASDNVGVIGVQFKLDGVNLGSEDTTAPYSLTWNTTTTTNAAHTLTATARDAAGNTTTSSAISVTVNNPSPPSSILWFADHEEGDMSDWYANNGGGESNSGDAVSMASTDVAHSGTYSAKATIASPPVAGVRLSRSQPSQIPQSAYFSSWYYFPQNYTLNDGHWNIFQFKSRDCDSGCPSATTDPFWYLNVGKRQDGTMYLTLRWWGDLWTLRGVEGPHQGEFGWYTYQQTLKDLPVRQWVHIEAFLRQSSGFTGQIIVWQDGVEIFNQDNVKTRYPYEGDRWSINNYSTSISPSPATIYMDDAAISSARLGPGYSYTTPATVPLSAPAPVDTIFRRR